MQFYSFIFSPSLLIETEKNLIIETIIRKRPSLKVLKTTSSVFVGADCDTQFDPNLCTFLKDDAQHQHQECVCSFRRHPGRFNSIFSSTVINRRWLIRLPNF